MKGFLLLAALFFIGLLLMLTGCNAAYTGGFANGLYNGLHGYPSPYTARPPVTCYTNRVGGTTFTNCY